MCLTSIVVSNFLSKWDLGKQHVQALFCTLHVCRWWNTSVYCSVYLKLLKQHLCLAAKNVTFMPRYARREISWGAMCVVVLSSSNLNSMLSKSSSSCFYRHQCLAYSCHIKKLSKTRTEQFTWTVAAFWHGAWLLWSTLAWCLVTVIYSGMVLSYCDLLWHGA